MLICLSLGGVLAGVALNWLFSAFVHKGRRSAAELLQSSYDIVLGGGLVYIVLAVYLWHAGGHLP